MPDVMIPWLLGLIALGLVPVILIWIAAGVFGIALRAGAAACNDTLAPDSGGGPPPAQHALPVGQGWQTDYG